MASTYLVYPAPRATAKAVAIRTVCEGAEHGWHFLRRDGPSHRGHRWGASNGAFGEGGGHVAHGCSVADSE